MLKYSFIYLAVRVLMSRVCRTLGGSVNPKLEFKTVMSFLGWMQGTEQNWDPLQEQQVFLNIESPLPITSFLVKTPKLHEMKPCKLHLENSYFDASIDTCL